MQKVVGLASPVARTDNGESKRKLAVGVGDLAQYKGIEVGAVSVEWVGVAGGAKSKRWNVI